MRVVTSPDNRCHFIVATAGPGQEAGASAVVGAGSERGVALEWSMNGQVV